MTIFCCAMFVISIAFGIWFCWRGAWLDATTMLINAIVFAINWWIIGYA